MVDSSDEVATTVCIDEVFLAKFFAKFSKVLNAPDSPLLSTI